MILLIQRHYLWEFLKTIVVIALGTSIIFSIVGFIDKMGEFMPYNPPKTLLILYVLYGIPVYMNYLMPVAALFSSLLVFSHAVHRLEITAIKSAGGRIKRIVIPFIVLGVLLTIVGFIVGELLSPNSFKKLHGLRNQIIKKTQTHKFKEGALYMRGKDGSVIRISLYLPEHKVCRDISIFRIDKDGLKEKIESPDAQWTERGWMLKDALITDLRDGVVKKEALIALPELDTPEIFQSEIWKSEEMTLPELLSYNDRLNNAGFRNMKLNVDIASRLIYSVVNLIMLMLGLTLPLSGERIRGIIFKKEHSHHNAITAGIGVLISLFYWLGYSFFLSLGYAGAVPPMIAPLIIPIVFSLLTVYLFSRIQE